MFKLTNILLGMGNAVAKISEEQLEIYQDETFFTRKEILAIFER